MGHAGVEVVEAAGPAQGHGALAIGDVVAEAEVARGAAPGRTGLGARGVGLGGRDATDRPVRPLFVVRDAEPIELRLELGEGVGGRLAREPALQRLVEALDLALGLGMARRSVLLADAEVGEQVLEAVAAPGAARRVDRGVVGQRGDRPAVGIARETSPDLGSRSSGGVVPRTYTIALSISVHTHPSTGRPRPRGPHAPRSPR